MPEETARSDEEIRRTLDGVSGLLSHRVRLGICVLLTRHSALSFSRLKELLGGTDGSLGAQLRKLEDERFITARKEFRDRKPVTWYTMTSIGREGLRSHYDALESLIGGS